MNQSAQARPATHQFDPTILRAYDIRGIVGETLHETDAYYVGRAFGTFVQREQGIDAGKAQVAVAYDGRLSSPALQEELVQGITDAGASVVRVGVGPTPLLYFAVRSLGLDGGVMVTGSHNPPTHNGFKMMLRKAALFGEQIQELGHLAASGDFESGQGAVEDRALMEDYVAALVAGYTANDAKPLKVVWDAGNGAGGDAMQALVKHLPGEHILLNEEVDGTFPAHHPDPSEPENLVQLIDKVKETGADMGVAFDGDADRIGAVDGQGRMLFGDQLMQLYAKDVLADYPGATVIADVKASQALFDTVAKLGGKPIIWKTGHSFIKSKMAETGAALGGEMSGHIFFADRYYGFDDGVYGAVRLINLVAKADGQSLADMLDSLPHMVNTPEIRVDVPEARKFDIIEEVRARLEAEGAEVSTIDGVRVAAEGGWWLLRASNTQAALVARAEAPDEAALERLKAALTRQLAESGETIHI